MNKNNYWHSRFYSKQKPLQAASVQLDSSFSDSLYDVNKGITHALMPYGETTATRYVSDVEICMTADLNISSHFTAEHRNAIRNQLLSQQRINPDMQLTDDEMLANGAPRSLERDELVKVAKNNINRLDSDIRLAQQMRLSEPPTPEPPTPEPKSSE